MSTNESIAQAFTRLSDFSSNSVITRLGVNPSDTLRTEAILHVFEKNRIEYGYIHPNRATILRKAIDATVKEVSFRLGLYETYATNFLRKHKDTYNQDELIIATVLGRYMFEFIRDNDFYPNYDVEILHYVHFLFNEAESLMEDNYEPNIDAHSCLLAHFQALEYFEELREDMDNLDLEQALEALHVRLPAIDKFADRKTDIGREIDKQLRDLQIQLQEIISGPAQDTVQDTAQETELPETAVLLQFPIKTPTP